MAKKAVGKPDGGMRDLAEDFESLEAALEEVVPGLEILDRDLVFDDGARADVAGVDAAGRLVLGLVAQDDRDRTSIEVLDALAFARGETDLVARHLASPKLQPGLEPRVILIVAPEDDRLVQRLVPLAGRGVDLFTIRRVRSASGERAYLVPVHSPEAGREGIAAEPSAFLETLGEPELVLAQLVAARMSRLDEEIHARGGSDAVVWSFRNEVLARLERVDSRLQGCIAPGFQPRRLASPADAEDFVEAATVRLIERIRDLPESGPAEPLLRPEDGTGPILTPEEIEAFRDV